MFKKPKGYDEVGTTTAVTPILPSGIYTIGILNAKEETSKKGNRMLVLSVDIVDGEYKNYYMNKYKNSNKEKKSWGCNYYSLVDGEHTQYFKALITAIEKSNDMTWDWELASLKGCVAAGLFQRQEIEIDDKIVWTTKLIGVRSIQAMQERSITTPVDKYLNRSNDFSNSNTNEDINDNDDIPF